MMPFVLQIWRFVRHNRICGARMHHKNSTLHA